jgi:hypothetical protein
MRGETGHQRQPLGILQIHDHALLVAIDELEQGAFAVAEWADVAVIIAARRRFIVHAHHPHCFWTNEYRRTAILSINTVYKYKI